MDHVAANISQMATLRQLFERKAADVDALVREVSAAVGEAGGRGSVQWEGQVAERFRQEWGASFVPNLRRLGEALQQHAAYVEANRQNISQALNGTSA